MMEIEFDEMPEELQKLYRKYYKIFGTHPDCYAEFDGPCLEAYDVKLIREAIEKKVELPTLILGENYWDDDIDYG